MASFGIGGPGIPGAGDVGTDWNYCFALSMLTFHHLLTGICSEVCPCDVCLDKCMLIVRVRFSRWRHRLLHALNMHR